MISGSRSGARAHPATHARSLHLAAKSAINFFLPEWRKVLHRLHRLACSACLHASQTKVAAASLTEAILGLTRMLQLQAKAKAKAPGTWYDLEMILATKNE
jgi:hypothetical protein